MYNHIWCATAVAFAYYIDSNYQTNSAVILSQALGHILILKSINTYLVPKINFALPKSIIETALVNTMFSVAYKLSINAVSEVLGALQYNYLPYKAFTVPIATLTIVSCLRNYYFSKNISYLVEPIKLTAPHLLRSTLYYTFDLVPKIQQWPYVLNIGLNIGICISASYVVQECCNAVFKTNASALAFSLLTVICVRETVHGMKDIIYSSLYNDHLYAAIADVTLKSVCVAGLNYWYNSYYKAKQTEHEKRE